MAKAEEVKKEADVAAQPEQKQPKVYKSFVVEYFDDDTVNLRSTGEQELSTNEMYDHVLILKDMIDRRRLSDDIMQNLVASQGFGQTIFSAAYQGVRRFYADTAEEKMKRENEAAKDAK